MVALGTCNTWAHVIPGQKGDVEVGIEPVAYPGRFLSLDANIWELNLQGVKSYAEEFILVLTGGLNFNS